MRILVVEDSRSLAEGIAEGLRDKGLAVDVAYDGLEAAAKLDVNTYDVVILDRDLPGLLSRQVHLSSGVLDGGGCRLPQRTLLIAAEHERGQLLAPSIGEQPD